jgi:hypothetical protein
MVKDHHSLIQRPAFCDFSENDVVLLYISGDVRWKREQPISRFKILIALTRRIEEGRVSQSLVRKGTEFLDV